MRTPPSFDQIIEAQRRYVAYRFGKKAAVETEYGIGSDGPATYVESLVRARGKQRILTTYTTDHEGKTSNVNFKGRPNALKHVWTVL